MALGTLEINNPFVSKMQLRLIDTDNLGHLSNVAYIAYLETIRTEWYAYLKGSRLALNAGKWDWILGGINIKFLKEALLSDEISIEMWCSRIGTKSWDFSYSIFKGDQNLIAIAQTSQIAFDYHSGSSITIPRDIHNDLINRTGKPWTEFTN